MSDVKILAIDTATEGCSAALLRDETVTEQFEVTPRGHTQRILPMVDQLLSEAGLKLTDLDAIAFNRGPGSFTGLRITAGVVQGLAYGAGLPVLPVSSLAALAAAHHRQNQTLRVVAAIDARMGEVYWGAYEIDQQGMPHLQGKELVVPPYDIPALEGVWSGAGSGWGEYREELKHHFQGELEQIDDTALPRASEIARLGKIELSQRASVSAAQAQPVYLRNNVVQR